MRIAITGASGFIGKHVVEVAVKGGHEVLALVRSSPAEEWNELSSVEAYSCDLGDSSDSNMNNLSEALKGCDALIHLAAVMSGENQYQATMQSTKNVLAAMDAADVQTLIGLSSISILDYSVCSFEKEIDEETPINTNDNSLGSYALMKRDQEALFYAWKSESKSVVVLRPGLVMGDNNLSDAHVGFKLFASSHKGEVPVVSVGSVAQACISAVENPGMNINIIHLTNDRLPSQKEYVAALKETGHLGARINLPWPLYNLAMTLLRIPLSLKGKTPDGLCKNSVHGRQKPLRFSNKKAKTILAWKPATSLAVNS